MFDHRAAMDFLGDALSAIPASSQAHSLLLAQAQKASGPSPIINPSIGCTQPSCQCKSFSEGSPSRICSSCNHGWVLHAVASLGNSLAVMNEVEVPQAETVFDVSSLILYASQAIPIRLKILLDRLFSALPPEDVSEILAKFAWSYEDYLRGYKLQNGPHEQMLSQWNLVSRYEESLVLFQFLRFAETRSVAQQFLLDANQRNDSAPISQKCQKTSAIRKFMESRGNLYRDEDVSLKNDASNAKSTMRLSSALSNISNKLQQQAQQTQRNESAQPNEVIVNGNNNPNVIKPIKAGSDDANSDSESYDANGKKCHRRVSCERCGKTFCDKGALKIHISAVHLKEMHRCTVQGCNMMFSSRRSRNRHSANPNPRLHCNMFAPRRGGILAEANEISTLQQQSSGENSNSVENFNLSHSAENDSLSGDDMANQRNGAESPDDMSYEEIDDKSTSGRLVIAEDSIKQESNTNTDSGNGSAAEAPNSINGEHCSTPSVAMSPAPTTQPRNKRKNIVPTRHLPSMLGDDAFTTTMSNILDFVCQQPATKMVKTEHSVRQQMENNSNAINAAQVLQRSNALHAAQAAVNVDNSNNVDGSYTPPSSPTASSLNIPEDPVNPCRCVECGKTFRNHFTARTHYQNVHLRVMHKCRIQGCSAEFPSKRSRDRHSANVNLHRKILGMEEESEAERARQQQQAALQNAANVAASMASSLGAPLPLQRAIGL